MSAITRAGIQGVDLNERERDAASGGALCWHLQGDSEFLLISHDSH